MRWIPVVFVLACAEKSDLPAAEEPSDTASSPPLSSDTAQSVDSDEDTAESDTNAPGDSGEVSEDTGAAPPPVGWRSALFPDDWVPGFGVATGEHFAQLQDFSYAGYRAGEEALPSVGLDGAVSVLDYGADETGGSDSTPAIQSAIDAVAVAGGGVVYLPEGTYRVDGLLSVTHSGTVIRGDGPSATRIGFTRHAAMSDINHLQFSGALAAGPSVSLVLDAEQGETVVAVADAAGLSVGDEVGVGMVITDAFREEHEMDAEDRWGFSAGQRRTIFKRTIVSIDRERSPQLVTLDVPLRYPLKVRDAADVRKESGAITDCGVQDLAVSTAVDWDAAWSNDRSHAIGFSDAKDCWARDIESWAGPEGGGTYHLQSGGIIVKRSRRVTVADSVMEHAQNRGGGGNGYLFELMQSGSAAHRNNI